MFGSNYSGNRAYIRGRIKVGYRRWNGLNYSSNRAYIWAIALHFLTEISTVMVLHYVSWAMTQRLTEHFITPKIPSERKKSLFNRLHEYCELKNSTQLFVRYERVT